MRFVKNGYYYLFWASLIALGAGMFIHPALGVFVFLVGVLLLLFFRDPERSPPTQKNALIAVADGKIMEIKEMKEGKFLKQNCVRIVTFLSPLDVHVNRSPIDGKVVMLEHVFGKYSPAFYKHAEKNERQYIGIAGKVPILVVLLVGTLARRIENWTAISQPVTRGERIGIMKFGSRADVYIPKKAVGKILVKEGDTVRAGETIIATLKH